LKVQHAIQTRGVCTAGTCGVPPLRSPQHTWHESLLWPQGRYHGNMEHKDVLREHSVLQSNVILFHYMAKCITVEK